MNIKIVRQKSREMIKVILDFIRMILLNSLLFLKESFKKIASFLNNYANVLVAIATISLAVITYFHIDEARNMRKETKRLVDISIEQFIIKSYPSLDIITEKPSLNSEGILQKFQINNMGDLTAFHVEFLPLHIFFETDGSSHISFVQSTYDESGKVRSTIDYDMKIVSHKGMEVNYKTRFTGKETLDKLKFLLIFLRFKVPYDEKFRYESFAYTLEKELSKEKSYMWSELPRADIEHLSTSCVKDLKGFKFKRLYGGLDKYQKVLNFLKDY